MELTNHSTIIKKQYNVTKDFTAKALGSGGLEVLATPQIAIWIERLAYRSLEDILPDDQTSVGTELLINHKAPSKLGSLITIKLEQKKESSRIYSFNFIVEDSNKTVADGKHTRVIVNIEKFLSKIK